METFFRFTGRLCRKIPRSTVSFPHKGQWRGALVFSLICVWINGWLNKREAGDLRRHCAHYDVIVMDMVQYLHHSSDSAPLNAPSLEQSYVIISIDNHHQYLTKPIVFTNVFHCYRNMILAWYSKGLEVNMHRDSDVSILIWPTKPIIFINVFHCYLDMIKLDI